MVWEETDQYIRSGHGNVEDAETCRTIEISEPKGIKAIYCKSKSTGKWYIQSYLFSKSDGWTMEKAKEWFTTHRQSFEQSFSWTPTDKIEALRAMGLGVIYKVASPHVGRTLARDTFDKAHEITLDEDEVKRMARTAIDKQWNLNHERPVKATTFDAEYEDGAVEQYVYCTDEEINRLFDEGKINHVSPEWCPRSVELVDGLAAKGIILTGFAFLTDDHVPGDGLSTIEKYQSLPDMMNKGDTVLISKSYLQSLEGKGVKKTDEKIKELVLERLVEFNAWMAWPPVPITEENFEKGDFAYAPGDNFSDWKLPHHVKGKLEKDGVAAALRRFGRTDLPAGTRDEVLAHLCAHAKDLGVESEQCDMRESIGIIKGVLLAHGVLLKNYGLEIAKMGALKTEVLEEFKQSLKVAGTSTNLQEPVLAINPNVLVSSAPKEKRPLTAPIRWRILQAIRENKSDEALRDLIE